MWVLNQKQLLIAVIKQEFYPRADAEVVEHRSKDVMAELEALLTEFAADAIPHVMDAQELLNVDGNVPMEAAEEGACASPGEESSEEEDQPAPTPITLREARACMAKVA